MGMVHVRHICVGVCRKRIAPQDFLASRAIAVIKPKGMEVE